MFNFTWLLPNTLIKGQMFEESYEYTYAKSRAFANLFQKDLLRKKAILNIMKSVGISVFVRKILFYWGIFPAACCSWYEFEKLKPGQGLYQLCLKLDPYIDGTF